MAIYKQAIRPPVGGVLDAVRFKSKEVVEPKGWNHYQRRGMSTRDTCPQCGGLLMEDDFQLIECLSCLRRWEFGMGKSGRGREGYKKVA